jgi:hypothetical protein
VYAETRDKTWKTSEKRQTNAKRENLKYIANALVLRTQLALIESRLFINKLFRFTSLPWCWFLGFYLVLLSAGRIKCEIWEESATWL